MRRSSSEFHSLSPSNTWHLQLEPYIKKHLTSKQRSSFETSAIYCSASMEQSQQSLAMPALFSLPDAPKHEKQEEKLILEKHSHFTDGTPESKKH